MIILGFFNFLLLSSLSFLMASYVSVGQFLHIILILSLFIFFNIFIFMTSFFIHFGNVAYFCCRLFIYWPFSLFNFIPIFCQSSSRLVMYTNCHWAVSCVLSIDVSSSIPQLNSLIEIFSLCLYVV